MEDPLNSTLRPGLCSMTLTKSQLRLGVEVVDVLWASFLAVAIHKGGR